MVLWGNDKAELLEKGKGFEAFINQNLNLELKPYYLNQTKKGLSFLGYRLFPHQVLLNQRSTRRFKSKLKRYNYNLENDIWTQKSYQQHVEPLVAFTEYADMNWWRKAVI
jgi:RNA-directed DNA polymerase